ncbi:MAG: hypothetical protein WAO58_00210 [Fimbriimonadaceae bacterium]
MFDKDLIERIQDESRPLSAADSATIERALEHTSVFSIAELPEEQVSLAWRSLLNERVAQLAAGAKRRTRWISIWRPALGLGLAGALAAAFMMQAPSSSGPAFAPKPAVEEALIQAHEMSVQGSEIAGAGLAEHEAVPVAYNADTELFDWSEIDVDTL